jgi:transcription elongation factor Elf1
MVYEKLNKKNNYLPVKFRCPKCNKKLVVRLSDNDSERNSETEDCPICDATITIDGLINYPYGLNIYLK